MSTSFHHVAKLRSLCVTLMLLVIGACNAFAQEPTARQQALRQIFQELIEIRWKRRQFEAFIRARNSNLDGDVTSSEFQFVQIGISREF